MQRRTVAALIVVVTGLALTGVFGGSGGEPAETAVDADSLVAVEGDHEVWPYTSRSRSVEGRTLAINVVFHADAESVERALIAESDADWQEANETESDIDSNVTRDIVVRDWDDAHGSTRYSYFTGAGGGWIDESFELHHGAYLGTRDHVRAYESPDGASTVVQVHEEYYDWFRLRHTVSGVADPAVRLENDFIGGGSGSEVRREYRGIEGGSSDGWISVIELALLAPALGALLRRRTRDAVGDAAGRIRREASRHTNAWVVGAALAAVVVGVRAAGVGIEAAYPAVTPKAIAAPLYLVIAVGLPGIVVAGIDRPDPTAAFIGVAAGLGAGFVVDFAALGVAVPPALIVHRASVLAALGVVAMGRAGENNVVVTAGLIAWGVGLALPLFGVV